MAVALHEVAGGKFSQETIAAAVAQTDGTAVFDGILSPVDAESENVVYHWERETTVAVVREAAGRIFADPDNHPTDVSTARNLLASVEGTASNELFKVHYTGETNGKVKKRLAQHWGTSMSCARVDRVFQELDPKSIRNEFIAVPEAVVLKLHTFAQKYTAGKLSLKAVRGGILECLICTLFKGRSNAEFGECSPHEGADVPERDVC